MKPCAKCEAVNVALTIAVDNYVDARTAGNEYARDNAYENYLLARAAHRGGPMTATAVWKSRKERKAISDYYERKWANDEWWAENFVALIGLFFILCATVGVVLERLIP